MYLTSNLTFWCKARGGAYIQSYSLVHGKARGGGGYFERRDRKYFTSLQLCLATLHRNSAPCNSSLQLCTFKPGAMQLCTLKPGACNVILQFCTLQPSLSKFDAMHRDSLPQELFKNRLCCCGSSNSIYPVFHSFRSLKV